MSRRWITESELREIRNVLAGPWLPPQPEAELRRALAWFPDAALLRWFSRGDGTEESDLHALSLEEAISWRRQLLKRNLESPLSSADRFLPLVRWREEGFLIYDGAARGVALRRTSHVERYAEALKSPLPLSELLQGGSGPAPPEPEEEDDPPEEVVHLDQHLERALGTSFAPASIEELRPLCDAPELHEWFSRVGPASRTLLSDLRALSFSDALVSRDQLEGAASAELQSRLHHLSWMPLLELPGRHVVIFWKNHGVCLHVHRDGSWREANWSRSVNFKAFGAALSAWGEPALPQHEDLDLIVTRLWDVTATWEEEPPARDVDSTRLAGFSRPVARALEAWFSEASETPFTEAGHRLVSSASLEPGLPIAPLLTGADGVDTCAVDGRGIVLRSGETRLPWAPSVTQWTIELADALLRRGTPGVSVRRNIVGHYRVELPWLPYELARRLERISFEQPEDIDADEFTIALGDHAEVRVEQFKPTLVLDQASRGELVAALDSLRAAELTWLEVTFVFKPLLG
jgi:hypothetical protein